MVVYPLFFFLLQSLVTLHKAGSHAVARVIDIILLFYICHAGSCVEDAVLSICRCACVYTDLVSQRVTALDYYYYYYYYTPANLDH